LVLFSIKRLIILRSPLTTSARVDQPPGISYGGAKEIRTTKGVVGRERALNLKFQLCLGLLYFRCLLGDCMMKCHLPAFIMRPKTNNSQAKEKREARKRKPLTKGAKRIMVWVYRI
jgi:hypothetical protein